MHGEPSVRACRRACAAMCRSARRVPAAQQRRPSDHSVLLRPHRWWRLLTPYRFKECPDHIIVKGAERTQPSRMGTFGKMAVSVDARPVYKNDFDQFLWYSRDEGNWLIGPDYARKERAVQSTSGAAPTSCPDEASAWASIGDDSGGSGEEEGGGWDYNNVTVATQWCGTEGPQLLWRPVARECGDRQHRETITSTLSECSAHIDGRQGVESGMSHLGSFWEDGALRFRTDYRWTATANTTDGRNPKPGRNGNGVDTRTEMVQVAEDQLHHYAQCRRHPEAYVGTPYEQLIEGGGHDADYQVPKCNEVQQMHGRCEGEPEFHFNYFRTCTGRLDMPETSWFCARGINRPGFLNPGLLGIELRADNMALTPAHVAAALAFLSAGLAVLAVTAGIRPVVLLARRTEAPAAAANLY